MARGSYVSESDIDAEIFGEPSQGTLGYLRERVERYAPRIRDAFDGFFEDAREIHERHFGEKALRNIRARIRKTASSFRKDVIRPLRTINEIQMAKPLMQRYIMANVMARIAAKAQTIDGYADSYDHGFPGKVGLNDPDFMRVIDGVIFTENEFGVGPAEDDDAWVAHQNMFDVEDERDLDIVEQADVMSTWRVLEIALAAKKKDPTSSLDENM